jgi:hypothetical protein
MRLEAARRFSMSGTSMAKAVPAGGCEVIGTIGTAS